MRLDIAESLEVHALLLCATADDCARVRAFVQAARDDLGAALGPKTPRVELAPERAGRVEFSFAVTLDELSRALEPNGAKR